MSQLNRRDLAVESRMAGNLLRLIAYPNVPVLARTREPWLRKSGKLTQRLLCKIRQEKTRGNSETCHFVHFRTRQTPRHQRVWVGSGVAPRESKPAASGAPPADFQQTHPPLPSLLFHHRDTCTAASKMQTRSSAKRVTRQSTRATIGTSHTSSEPTHPTARQPRHPGYRTHPRSAFVSPGSKRAPGLQEDTPKPKRRRSARKRTRPATSDTEALPSSSGSSASFDYDSELIALRRTLQQVQEDLSSLQQDQRQLDDITRGMQHDLDELQPYDTLRFLEEHFTCAL